MNLPLRVTPPWVMLVGAVPSFAGPSLSAAMLLENEGLVSLPPPEELLLDELPPNRPPPEELLLEDLPPEELPP